MAKRPLGLGKQAQKKKQKVASREATPDTTPSNQISIELNDEEDADNELAQLNGLWNQYFKSDKDDEILLNGMIHECDRILRIVKSDDDASSEERGKLTKLIHSDDRFYACFALALSELTVFKSENVKEVSEFFNLALERCEDGLKIFSHSDLLSLVFSKIIFQRIPLEFISKLKVDSKEDNLKLKLYEQFEKGQEKFNVLSQDKNNKQNEDYLRLTFEVLQSYDDLMDIIENFGHEKDIEEGLDSDEEEELAQIELAKSHPLFQFQKNFTKDLTWLKDQLINLFKHIKDHESPLYHQVARSIGELYLKFAENPSSVYLDVVYGDDRDESSKEDDETKTKSQREAVQLLEAGLEYLKKAQLKDSPETWVQVAEAFIDLGNVQDNESAEQEAAYKSAEQLLRKANRATNGKYEHILDNLINES
ncbi:hypothetical protein NCAS_0G00570 [Naumovozyma castellii]|uniref:Enhancer of translation termination 1 n=1 Tax=Naumovozyma castellii TaxID=27288 RepID=G0VHR0_NAUCA|nr:hypothetical protein NCAS_0G00570 [Naumovozyma castellii CBS 4309]CCC70944.1 hypothetical protein NCAS_0G00570 [Naumovozyma castellii CBS 4309]